MDKVKRRISKFEGGPVWRLLGIETEYAEENSVKIVLPIREDFFQINGVVQGGIIATALDAAMATVLSVVLDENEFCTTIDLHVNYLRPLTGEKLIAQADIVKKGKSVAVLTAQAYDENNKMIATANANFMILSK